MYHNQYSKSIFAPRVKAQFAEATNVTGVVQTISFFIPKALQAKNKEEVELFKVNEYLHFNVWISFSNKIFSFPWVRFWLFNTLWLSEYHFC